MLRLNARVMLPALLLALVGCGAAQTSAKKKVTSQSDLPRFSYPLNMPASQFVQSDRAKFEPFAEKVGGDVDSVLRDYDIADKTTLRTLLSVKLNIQELAGNYSGALETVKQIRVLEEKPAERLTSGLFTECFLNTALKTKSTAGKAFDEAFSDSLQKAVNSLPWEVVQDNLKGALAQATLASKAALLGFLETEIDPAVEKSKALNNEEAWTLIAVRRSLEVDLPVASLRAGVLAKYVAAHNAAEPDIWKARDVTLTSADHLSPVLVGIWDSGVDVSLFRKRVFSDPHPTASGNHGWAFDDQGQPSSSWLYPLTPAERKEYPLFITDIKGQLDIEDGIDSPDAQAVRKKFQTETPAQIHASNELDKVIGFYMHGTHVAGIAARGNPAIRLVVARFDDQLPDLPFPPTPEWAHRLADAFQKMSDYFRTRNVRVVNMSWDDDPQEFEQWLSKTGGPSDPAARKERAAELYSIWHDAVENAIKNAPNTLFVCAAGNSDSNATFLRDVPAGLELPNLIAVGAVNQAGKETSFTSYGPTVLVDADGYQVESVVPGGTKLKLSGTSMASPNVVNLAAKLFALDPSLTPQQVVQLIRNGATASAEGRLHLIDAKRSVELLRRQGRASAAAAR